VTAVASGSVFRALDKGNGPERFPQSSYGFLRNEPFEPALFPSHKTTTAIHDSVDWDWYVKVINYVIVRVRSKPKRNTWKKSDQNRAIGSTHSMNTRLYYYTTRSKMMADLGSAKSVFTSTTQPRNHIFHSRILETKASYIQHGLPTSIPC
jgi:hypothetical protein